MSAGMLLLLLLPFLLSLAGQRRSTPIGVCLVSSIMAMLLSVEPDRALLPWGLGMVVAVVSIRERMRARGLI